MTQHRDNEGEKELVIGNRQLLSFFFVVVALCGVFFAIGYIIGRNAGKAAIAEGAAAPPVAEGKASPIPVSPSGDTPSPAPLETKAAQEPPPETRPEPAAPSVTRAVPVTAAEKGASYLQVTALPRTDAEAVVRTLQDQGFPAIMTESSKDGFFRVMAGPYREAAQLSAGKDRLRALGFANTIIHKQ